MNNIKINSNPKSTMKPTTFETLIADQQERIVRSNLREGDNAILDWINDLNKEL